MTQHNEASVSGDRGRKAGLGGAPIFAEATISAECSARPSTRCAARCVAILRVLAASEATSRARF